ncbi:UDP-N-acetylglucosamine 1-carboxyvinyltransferase [Daejeonella sp. H1SJ63]|jgi:UDP-N-acetylglucosamine 1-carboxyvinyltransferase|uniref:UDP-N-acetylglucosamine 1-carboxyvinyltransferase n=1 Tax=Daejeonella sp. H1SJ63 TaxID=3034145 RepID=UPI0023EC23E9|nr:UDP-N-acetylglucosamine 1-carboxyvinyltransferase [Daejeonella sp. H1SJ63]
MNAFEIVGGKPLKGEIIPQGAKNEALQIISAVLLTEEKITISNIPDIQDVNKLIELIGDLGVKTERINKDTYTFEAKNINLDFFQSAAFKSKGGSLRGSIMIVGPLLARFGKAAIPKPGGDKIGRRRLDTHFLGFEKLGAKFVFDKKTNFFNVDASNLQGAYILLDEASVTGTANVVMAAVLAKGITTIYNAACEPYLQQLCKMLNRMGAKISGIGSNLLKIEGVKKLGGTEHRLLPDMIEIGSFIGLAAMTESEITIKNVHYEELGMIPAVFKRLGIQFELRGDDIYIPAQKHYEIETFIDGSIMTIADAPWPGFTPDLLSIMLVVATQSKGNVLIHQKMFESRLFFVDKLIDMGAQIILCDPHRATVIGLDKKVKLRGIEMTSPDIRAGVSLLIAALSAQGKSVIHNIEQIERGYQDIDVRLRALGADIKRIVATTKPH